MRDIAATIIASHNLDSNPARQRYNAFVSGILRPLFLFVLSNCMEYTSYDNRVRHAWLNNICDARMRTIIILRKLQPSASQLALQERVRSHLVQPTE